jgi:hypothetical protein
MFLGAYDFDGDVAELLVAYGRLMEGFPPESIELHVCVVRDTGITVMDACPSAAVFAEFSSSPGFRDGLAAVGLPLPTIRPLGEVRAARLRQQEVE